MQICRTSLQNRIAVSLDLMSGRLFAAGYLSISPAGIRRISYGID